jgi:hypothetical protein
MFQHAAQGVLDLLGIDGTLVDTSISSELPPAHRLADLVWKVRTRDGHVFLLHIELQVKDDKKIGARVLDYALRLWMRDGIPVYSVVIYLRQIETPTDSSFGWNALGSERLSFQFDVIRLWEKPKELILGTPHYELWPLAALMGEGSVDEMVAVAKHIGTAPLPGKNREGLIRDLSLLAGIRLPKLNLLELLRRQGVLDEILEESSLKEVFEDYLRPRLEAEGELKATRHMARLALQSRFGPLGKEVIAAIERADKGTLEVAVTSSSLEEARRQLGL